MIPLMKVGFFLASPFINPHKLAILKYHRVLPEVDPLQPNVLDVKRFEQEIGAISQIFNIIDLETAVDLLFRDQLPKRSVAITFDDGYRDNFDCALPILQKYDVPASFFIVTKVLNNGIMWNDQVLEAIRVSKVTTLDMRDEGLPLYPLDNLAAKRAAIEHITKTVKHLPAPEQQRVVARIIQHTRAELPLDLMLTEQQVVALKGMGMGIGSHAVEHYILTTLEDKDAETNIQQSKITLEALLGQPVTMYTYPNGKKSKDYQEKHVEMVRRSGYSLALNTDVGGAATHSDRFQLPRVSIWNKSRIFQVVNVMRLLH